MIHINKRLLFTMPKGRRHHFMTAPNGTVQHSTRYISGKVRQRFISRDSAQWLIKELRKKGAKVTRCTGKKKKGA